MEETTAPPQDLFRPILLNRIHKGLDHQNFNQRIFPVMLETMDFIQDIIDQLESSGQSPEICCRQGCCLCCHSLVTIIPAEGFLIYQFLETHFNSSQMNHLFRRINTNRLLLKGSSMDRRYELKDQTPCIFLSDNICSIYPVRPFICRSFNAVEPGACQTAYSSEDRHTLIPTAPLRNYLFGTARDLFQELCTSQSVASDPLDLMSAIESSLSCSGPVGAWLSQE